MTQFITGSFGASDGVGQSRTIRYDDLSASVVAVLAADFLVAAPLLLLSSAFGWGYLLYNLANFPIDRALDLLRRSRL